MHHLTIIGRRLLRLRHNSKHPILYRYPPLRGLILAAVIRLQTFGKPIGLRLELLLSQPGIRQVDLGPHLRSGRQHLVTSKSGMFSPSTRWVHRGVFRTNPVTQLHQPVPSHPYQCSAPTTAGRLEGPDILAKNRPCRLPAALAWQAMSTRFSTPLTRPNDRRRNSRRIASGNAWSKGDAYNN